MKYTVLGIDPATRCGWALDNMLYGTWDLSIRKDESWGMRLLRLEAKLHEVYNAFPTIKAIGYERPGGRNTIAIITQSKIIGIIEKFCKKNNIEYKGYSSSEIKKYSGNKGNCGKPEVINAAKEKLGYEGDDDNEADALWLLQLIKRDLKL